MTGKTDMVPVLNLPSHLSQPSQSENVPIFGRGTRCYFAPEKSRFWSKPKEGKEEFTVPPRLAPVAHRVAACGPLCGLVRRRWGTDTSQPIWERVGELFGAPKAEELHSEILYIGFWTDKGNADSATLELLSKLRDKKVFLFGTAGFGGSEAYFQKILDHVKQSVGPSNSVFGEYMCQGKMPQSVRDRYMKMKTQPEHPANIDALIENFDRALSHPDEDDLERLRKIVLDRQ